MSCAQAETAVGETLRILIERYLSQFLFENACFLCERLYAHEKTAESLNLLAQCYMKADKYYRAYQILNKGMTAQPNDCFLNSEFKFSDELEVESEAQTAKVNDLKQVNKSNRYLLAKCCYTLGKLREAESALLQEHPELRLHGPHKCGLEILSNPKCLDKIPNGAAGLYLLGLICVKDNRREHAIDYFALSLKLDPFLWDSYEQLCALGAEIPPTAFFGDDRNAPYTEELFAGDAPELFGEGHRVLPVRAPLPIPTKTVGVANVYPPCDYYFIESTLSGENSDRSPGAPLQTLAHGTRKKHGAGGSLKAPLFQLTPTERQFGWPTPVPVVTAKISSLPRNFRHGSCLSSESKVSQHAASSEVSWSPPLARGQSQAQGQTHGARRGTRRNSWKEIPQVAENMVSNPIPNAPSTQGVRRSSRQQALHRSNRNFHGNNNSTNDSSINPETLVKDENENDDSENNQVGVSVSDSNVVVMSSPADTALKKSPVSSPNNNENKDNDSDAKQDPTTLSEECNAIEGSQGLLSLLRVLGEGLLLLSQYNCLESRKVFAKLPPEQYYTGWVLHHMGKAAFEMADYRAAQESFEKMRMVSPSRTAGLEVYSTNLWHLKEEVALCYLAQQSVDMDKRSPEAWCVIGNCFSLQKEHDVAIKFFQRALQLDPNFTYAHTLSGHEYVSNEDFEKAVACYRHAIRTDARHYNAWYGLGTIYYRQEKYELAEYHFRRALAINSRSSVLYCYLGMVLHASQKCEDALKMLQYATELEPSNPQAKFQRANVLRTMECYEAALEELMSVRDSAPREASVHFLMGKICKQLGRRDEAMIHFTTALDLDPKDSNMIKLSIDKLDSSDVDEEDDL